MEVLDRAEACIPGWGDKTWDWAVNSYRRREPSTPVRWGRRKKSKKLMDHVCGRRPNAPADPASEGEVAVRLDPRYSVDVFDEIADDGFGDGRAGSFDCLKVGRRRERRVLRGRLPDGLDRELQRPL